MDNREKYSNLENILKEQGLSLWGDENIKTMVFDYLYSEKKGYEGKKHDVRKDLTKYFRQNTALAGKETTELASRVILELKDISKQVEEDEIKDISSEEAYPNMNILQKDFIYKMSENLISASGLEADIVLTYNAFSVIETKILSNILESEGQQERFEGLFNRERKLLRSNLKHMYSMGDPDNKKVQKESGKMADELLGKLIDVADDIHAVNQIKRNLNESLEFWDNMDKELDDDLVEEIFGGERPKSISQVKPIPPAKPIKPENKSFISNLLPELKRHAETRERDEEYIKKNSVYLPLEHNSFHSMYKPYKQIENLFVAGFYPDLYKQLNSKDEKQSNKAFKKLQKIINSDVEPKHSSSKIFNAGINMIEVKLKRMLEDHPVVKNNLKKIEDRYTEKFRERAIGFLKETNHELENRVEEAVDKVINAIDRGAHRGLLKSPRYDLDQKKGEAGVER